MKRRSFINKSIQLITGLLVLNEQKSDKKKPRTDNLSIFIVSDAHIGWKGKDQPTIEHQAQLIERIKNRFPYLDLVFDTGDIHHGNLNKVEKLAAQNQWLKYIANKFSDSLFHYIPGNHELGRGSSDTELIASKIGSQNLKPYYSFDYKGIHFISLPELLDTILVNQESLDWLSQDLKMNCNKSTIILSHNSIDQTTDSNGKTGYRVLVNSNEVLEILNQSKNVIAWLHGHNHHYEIVKKHERLYVSNGRLGGFNPTNRKSEFGHGHLGGIYIEVEKNNIKIQCYSATKEDFLANLGYPNLSKTLDKETTFSSSAPTNYYYGFGALTQNVKLQVYNHYLTNEDSQIFLDPTTNSIINDNFDFRYTNKLFSSGKNNNRIIGFRIRPKGLKITSTDTGLLINNSVSSNLITILFPPNRVKKDGILSRGSYYRCFLGDKFSLKMKISDNEKKNLRKVKFSYSIKNEYHQELFISQNIELENTNNEYISNNIFVPNNLNKKHNTNNYYIQVFINIENNPTIFTVNYIKLEKNEKRIIGDNNSIEIETNEKKKILSDNKMQPQSEVLLSMPNLNKKTSLLIKVPNVKWQIRNAIANYKHNTIEITKYRHNFQTTKQVLLIPTVKKSFYVNELRNIMPCKIIYSRAKITCLLENYSKNSILVIKTQRLPTTIVGAKVKSYINRTLVLIVDSNIVNLTI